MATKTSETHLLDFFTTSLRLTDACRSAVKFKKRLAQCATIHDLTHGVVKRKPAHAFQFVMLSHAEDDPQLLTAPRVEPVVSESFHLLFTEPTTHPDQVAQWIRATNIRAENRLHIVKMVGLEAPQMSELLTRICSALEPDGPQNSIIDAYLGTNTLFIRGPQHRMLHVPLASVPALAGQPRDAIQNFQIDPDGSFMYWPALDVHLGWSQFLQAADPTEFHKAQQRSADFNRRYGAAIRKVREAAGIPQTKVPGLTERQLRRVEQGKCRATRSALASLALAHGIDLNAYLEKLAKSLS